LSPAAALSVQHCCTLAGLTVAQEDPTSTGGGEASTGGATGSGCLGGGLGFLTGGLGDFTGGEGDLAGGEGDLAGGEGDLAGGLGPGVGAPSYSCTAQAGSRQAGGEQGRGGRGCHAAGNHGMGSLPGVHASQQRLRKGCQRRPPGGNHQEETARENHQEKPLKGSQQGAHSRLGTSPGRTCPPPTPLPSLHSTSSERGAPRCRRKRRRARGCTRQPDICHINQHENERGE